MPKTPAPLLRIREEADRIAVCFADNTVLGEANAEEFGRQLVALTESRDRPHLSLDLSGVTMLSSVALSKFIMLNGKVRAVGGRLTLTNPNPSVSQIFRITRLDTILEFVKPEAVPA